MIYRLDVDDAIVTVRLWESSLWWWTFTWLDGSSRFDDNDWHPTERGAKQEAKAHYNMKTRKLNPKRARWLKQNDNKANEDSS